MDSLFEPKGRKRIINDGFGNISSKGEIIAISHLSLKNGSRLGFRKCGKFLETTRISDYDIDMYLDDYNLRAEETHEDGTNHILYRETKPDLTDRQIMNFMKRLAKNDLSCLSQYTNSLLKYIS